MGPDGPVGFTCQAFSSLSLRPPRIVLCPSRTSTTWPIISARGSFCVNVLAENQRSLGIQFAQSGGDRFQGVSHGSSPPMDPRYWQALPHGSTTNSTWNTTGRPRHRRGRRPMARRDSRPSSPAVLPGSLRAGGRRSRRLNRPTAPEWDSRHSGALFPSGKQRSQS
ncbi:flavin reductase family protein [Streptomyces sp. LBL]|uniref:flavin reductase family protein n=1 Tax=Streptomyces sp. LBL TaxID=2940562 RepID=UPI0024769649|nr:flavin reductase family protein [Streptomyces sp. LBL]